MRRLTNAILALLLAAAAALAPSPATPTADATSLTTFDGIVPGNVNRTSVNLEASYDARLRLNWATRGTWVDSVATIRNTSGHPIDRIEFNTVAAKLGSMSFRGAFVDGVAVKATVADQTIVVPLGGVLPAGASTTVDIRYSSRLRTSLSGSSWMFTKANGIANLYRWLPWVSRVRRFDRPNIGDPFVTPTSPYVRVRIVPTVALRFATSGERVSTNGLEQVFEARNVRDFTVTAATDFVTSTTTVGSVKVIGVARSAAVAAKLRYEGGLAFTRLRSLLGPYPYASFRVVQSAGGTAMESPSLVWIPYGLASSRYRYLVTHETAHQWFYGLVGNDQAAHPFTDEAAADFAARYALSARRSSTCATDELDHSIYHYSSACYYEVIYIQGGNVLESVRRQMGSTRFWAAIRQYLLDNRYRLVTPATLLKALDDATSLDLSRTLRSRFPSIY